mgnify:CR=1 FL=1
MTHSIDSIVTFTILQKLMKIFVAGLPLDMDESELEEFFENLGGFRALDGEGGKFGTAVGECNACRGVFFQPGGVLVDLRGVDDEKVFFLREAVGDEIVDHAATFIKNS